MLTRRNARSVCWALCLAVISIGSPANATENGCVECHQDPDFFSRDPKLHNYYQEWLGSPHAEAGTTCDDCHGGRASRSELPDAHTGMLPMIDPGSRLYYANQPRTCGACHSDKRDQFMQSRHYQALMEERKAPTCTTCHRAMSQRPEYRLIVLNACRNCHNEASSEQLPLIADQAEDALHQLNMAKGFIGWITLHYESRGWPGDSKEETKQLQETFERLVTDVHRFEIEQTSEDSSALLAQLKQMFTRARESQSTAEETDED